MLIDRAESVLLLVDLQVRLMPAISGGEAVLGRAAILAEAARRLNIPVVVTEHNPDALGKTVPALVSFADDPVRKRSFNACAGSTLLDRLPKKRRMVIVAGTEAHVCVLQTAMGLRQSDRFVFVAVDAVGSRRGEDKKTALGRLAGVGCTLVTTEMVLFEWLANCDGPQFRDILALIKAG